MSKNGNKYVIITGTGRAGTTPLVQLLTNLGLDTGFSVCRKSTKKPGLELRPFGKNLPEIIKSPKLYRYWKDVNLQIRHVIIPIRNIDDAVGSRIRKQAGSRAVVDGGLYGTKDPLKQKDILLIEFYNMILEFSLKSIPITFINYPKMFKKPYYLYHNLARVFPKLDQEKFLKEFRFLIREEWVHGH